MSRYNWIDPEAYTMDTLLLFDRWILEYWLDENAWYNRDGRDYKTDLAAALKPYPHVVTYCKEKAPEKADFLDRLLAVCPPVTPGEAREAEKRILGAQETFVVYAYPRVMNQVNYIRAWDPSRLYALADFREKIVLDVGAGTGRLAFAAAKLARRVYASEPCDTLREYMRDIIAEKGLQNVKVLDGTVVCLPYEDDTFDIVTAGHVVGDDYDREIAEMTRVLRPGGWIVCCNGDDEFRRQAPNGEMLSRGFQAFCHESSEGGIIYDYTLQIQK